MSKKFSLSIVSHGQLDLIEPLLQMLDAQQREDFGVILTLNIPENESPLVEYGFPLKIIRNALPKGFGANHNAAFAAVHSDYFVIVNPDIRFETLDLERMIEPFSAPTVGCCAPLVVSPLGLPEDSARRFPTWTRLARRLNVSKRVPDYVYREHPIDVDWVGGMFIVFRHAAFEAVGGFDDKRFFMYYEDVDLCKRLHLAGWRVMLHPKAEVVHDAQRASHRNFRHMRWHATSLFRFLTGL